MERERTSNGVPYEWSLANADGAAFTLYPVAGMTRDQVREAEAEIRRNRDVVRISVSREEGWAPVETPYPEYPHIKSLGYYTKMLMKCEHCGSSKDVSAQQLPDLELKGERPAEQFRDQHKGCRPIGGRMK